MCARQSRENLVRNQSWPAFLSQEAVCTLKWRVWARCWGSDFPSGVGLQGEEWGWWLWRYSEEVNTTQPRESRGKCGSASEARDDCPRSPLTPCTPRPQDHPHHHFESAVGGMSWLWSVMQRWAWWSPQRLPSCTQGQVTTHNFQGALASWLFLGTHNPRPTHLGEPVATFSRPLRPEALPEHPNGGYLIPPSP